MKKVDRNQWFVTGLKVLENDGWKNIVGFSDDFLRLQ